MQCAKQTTEVFKILSETKSQNQNQVPNPKPNECPSSRYRRLLFGQAKMLEMEFVFDDREGDYYYYFQIQERSASTHCLSPDPPHHAVE